MKITRWILLFTLFLIACEANAQAILKMESGALNNVPSNPTDTSHFTLNFKLYNIGNTLYRDTTVFPFIVNGIQYNFPFSIDSGISFTPVADNIPAHDSTTKSITFDFNHPAFMAGPSVVVIWPKAFSTGALTADSLTKTIIITHQGSTSINNPDRDAVSFYSDGQQIFLTSQLKNISGHVRI
jgi:hypothetical protein